MELRRNRSKYLNRIRYNYRDCVWSLTQLTLSVAFMNINDKNYMNLPVAAVYHLRAIHFNLPLNQFYLNIKLALYI
jgi:hypothetical protein